MSQRIIEIKKKQLADSNQMVSYEDYKSGALIRDKEGRSSPLGESPKASAPNLYAQFYRDYVSTGPNISDQTDQQSKSVTHARQIQVDIFEEKDKTD